MRYFPTFFVALSLFCLVAVGVPNLAAGPREVRPMPLLEPDFSQLPAENPHLVYRYNFGERPPLEDLYEPESLVSPAAQPADGGAHITDTSAYPYSAIVNLNMNYGDYWTSCSGALVNNNHTVLTAAHCIYDWADGWPDQVIVMPGRDSGSKPFGEHVAYNLAVPDAWIDYHNNWEDWGIVILEPIDDGAPGMFDDFAVTRTDFYVDRLFQTAGYPGDTHPGHEMWWDVGEFGERYLSYGVTFDFRMTEGVPFSCEHGQSGSTVFTEVDDELVSVAVLFGGGCWCVPIDEQIHDRLHDFNCGGCLIDLTCYPKSAIDF